MRFEFVLTDLTTDATPTVLKPAQCFARMVEAIGEDLSGAFAVEHGAVDFGFRIALGAGDRAGNELAVHFRDTIPEAPGALAYHTSTNGIPDIEIGVDLFPDLDGTDGMIKGVDHEVKELIIDPGANQLAVMGDGSSPPMPKEVCDFVQNLARRTSNGAFVSAFLLQAAWIPGAAGPWDSEGAMQSQSDSSNGYDPSSLSSVAALPFHLRKRKLHAFARTRRRLVKQHRTDRAIAAALSGIRGLP